MADQSTPSHLLILDIDGLRQDFFSLGLRENRIPNLAFLLGSQAIHLKVVCPAPSITFSSQTSIFTGQHPDQHGIAGNQFFDRFGTRNAGVPRLYAFDIGDTLAVDDAVSVFSGPVGLLGQILPPEIPTLYEIAGRYGWTSTVVYHMLSRGTHAWIRPNLVELARFIKGGGLLGLSAEQFDAEMMDQVLSHLFADGCPNLLTVYFMGLDHHSHQYGPYSQLDYLCRVVEPQVGRLLKEFQSNRWLEDILVVIVSDHGHIQVVPDDRHSLRLGFPFDREMGYLFDKLGLDVHDLPGEGPACQAVVACNGGLAHVYLQNRMGRWQDPPRFQEDVLPVAAAFWEANRSGRYSMDLLGALSLVLARNAEQTDWQAPYQVFDPQASAPGDTAWVPLPHYLDSRPNPEMVEAVNRLDRLAGPHSGDLLLVSNYRDGFYFGAPIASTHGGLHPEESWPVLSIGWPGASSEQVERLRSVIFQVTQQRQNAEGRKFASLVDLVPVLQAFFNWK